MTNFVKRLLGAKAFIYPLLSLPALYLVFLGATDGFGADPIEFLLLASGEYTVWIFVTTLWITPLRILSKSMPPISVAVRQLGRRRRNIGVVCFVYAVCHLTFYVLHKVGELDVLATNLGKPFILFGLTAFLILAAMAFTSTNAAIKRLGVRRWKNLHRLVYGAAGLIFLHMVLKDEGDLRKAGLYFFPLLLGEAYRVVAYIKSKSK